MSAQINNTTKAVTKSAVESPSTTLNGRLSKEPGSRFYNSFLRNMHGAFLTVLDPMGRILYVAGAAIRMKVDNDNDEIIIMTPEDIMTGLSGGYQPEYRSIILNGAERRGQHKVVFRDIPFISAYLGNALPQASSWGIMNVNPVANHAWSGPAPFCQNTEHHLDHRTWHIAKEMGPVNGQGGNDLSLRLAPEAKDIAEKLQSAIGGLVTGAYLFGGMPNNIPEVEPIKASAVIGTAIKRELSVREAKLQAQRERRASDRTAKFDEVRSRRTPRTQKEGFNNLLKAINPTVLDKMEQLTQADAGGSGVSS